MSSPQTIPATDPDTNPQETSKIVIDSGSNDGTKPSSKAKTGSPKKKILLRRSPTKKVRFFSFHVTSLQFQQLF